MEKSKKEKIERNFGENYYELTVREIENTISKKVLDRALFNGDTVEYKKQFEQKDYTKKDVYMGKFIDQHYKLKKKYSTSNGTGTISNKLEFSKRIAKNINDYGDLSRQAINLCEKINKFIQHSNNK